MYFTTNSYKMKKVIIFVICVVLLTGCDPYRRIRKHVPKKDINKAMKYSTWY